MNNNAQTETQVPDPELESLFGSIPPPRIIPLPAGEGIREEKGREMAAAGLVEFPDLPVAELRKQLAAGIAFPVRSQSNPHRCYSVNGTCDCKDFQLHYQPGFRCKHQVAQAVALDAKKEEEFDWGWRDPNRQLKVDRQSPVLPPWEGSSLRNGEGKSWPSMPWEGWGSEGEHRMAAWSAIQREL